MIARSFDFGLRNASNPTIATFGRRIKPIDQAFKSCFGKSHMPRRNHGCPKRKAAMKATQLSGMVANQTKSPETARYIQNTMRMEL